MIEERMAACERRLEAQYSLLYKLAVFRGLTTGDELEMLFNTLATGLQTRLLQTVQLPEVSRLIEVQLAEIGKLRRDLEV
jgi:hypothetical protein